MPQHHFLLRPMARAPGEVEVLQVHKGRVLGVLPRPGRPRDAQVQVGGYQDSSWTPAHMAILFGFIGWGRRNVAIARPHRVEGGWQMWQVVIEDESC